MTRWRETSIRTTSSTGLLVSRGLVIVLFITALTFVALSRSQHTSLAQARIAVLGQMAPVFEVMAKPIEAWHSLLANMSGVWNAHHTNQLLKAENDTLRHWQSVAMSLKAENEALRQMMQYQPVERATYVSAKITGHIGGAFAQQVLINAGKSDGLKPYQAVIDSHGLIGRVMDSDDHTSRVLLINDASSRIPVVTATSRERAIIVGTSGELLRLAFVSPQSKTQVGDVVLTTEEGGLMPANIMVGTVFSIQDRTVMVKPMRPVDRAEFVRIVQHRSH
ncbi:MAG: rod shape-determining protein MreC [Alphaproteobacteria bacterium]|nr:rod shape-determining protein MreC [Alphaproteobacteria bacterium]